jgi:hypothetical protein
MQNKKSSSSEGKGLLNTRTDVLLLIGGAFFLLVNVIVIFGIDTRPNAWLFDLNMRYWSVSFSVILWITALWLVSESMSIAEDYLLQIRVLTGSGILLVIIFALLRSLGGASSLSATQSLWLDVVLFVTLCNVFRSLFLLYDYFYGENDSVWEEAQWCWGASGFIFVGLAVWGLMHVISVKVQAQPGATIITETLLTAFQNGLKDLIQTGGGSLGLRMFLLLLAVSAIAFVYVLGRWLLIVYLKLRGELKRS